MNAAGLTATSIGISEDPAGTTHEETEEQMERREQAALEEKEREELQHDEIMQVRQMKKRELVEYANTRYNQKLSERDTVEVLQGAVIQMIEQFGVV